MHVSYSWRGKQTRTICAVEGGSQERDTMCTAQAFCLISETGEHPFRTQQLLEACCIICFTDADGRCLLAAASINASAWSRGRSLRLTSRTCPKDSHTASGLAFVDGPLSQVALLLMLKSMRHFPESAMPEPLSTFWQWLTSMSSLGLQRTCAVRLLAAKRPNILVALSVSDTYRPAFVDTLCKDREIMLPCSPRKQACHNAESWYRPAALGECEDEYVCFFLQQFQDL